MEASPYYAMALILHPSCRTRGLEEEWEGDRAQKAIHFAKKLWERYRDQVHPVSLLSASSSYEPDRPPPIAGPGNKGESKTKRQRLHQDLKQLQAENTFLVRKAKTNLRITAMKHRTTLKYLLWNGGSVKHSRRDGLGYPVLHWRSSQCLQ